MIADLSVYLTVFVISAFLMAVFQKYFSMVRIRGFTANSTIINGTVYGTISLFFLFLPIAMTGLRYGIGSDYYNYERFFYVLHDTKLRNYLDLHSTGDDAYYVELGYYVLNRLFPSYRLLLWGIGGLIFLLLSLAIREYTRTIRFSFAVYIFLCTQLIYSFNGSRFSVAICWVLLAYISLAKDNVKGFVLFVIMATLFHRSTFFCIAMIFLKRYKYKGTNSIRNLFLFVAIILFPFFSGYTLRAASRLSFFARYFEKTMYAANDNVSWGFVWTLHIIPVILPLLLVCRKEIFSSEDTSVYFRICLMEIPFRMIALYNTWYTRFSRCSQIIQVIFIPLVLARIEKGQKKQLLYVYYIVWYTFYFAYYAIVNDKGDSLPYAWIFSIQ